MAIKTEAKTVTISMPDSAGIYWWRKDASYEWQIVHVHGVIGKGWGLCVRKNNFDITLDDFGGQWGPQVIPPER